MLRSKLSDSLKDEEKELLLRFFPKGLVSFDFEMTGVSPVIDKIIEIAGIKLLPNGDVELFQSLVNPLIEIPKATIPFHQITDEMVKDAPTLKKPLREFISFYENLPLVAHNSMYDAGFLVRGIHQFNFDISLSDVYDTCKMGRLLFKNANENKPNDFKLNTLAEFYGIDFNHHIALSDAHVCMKVFSKLLAELKKGNEEKLLRDKAFLFKLNAYKKAPDYELPKSLDLLKDGIIKKEKLLMTYKGGTQGEAPRPIIPLSIVPLPLGLTLYAECLLTNTKKSFMVKKIKKITKA